jgi:hypothetical protein
MQHPTPQQQASSLATPEEKEDEKKLDCWIDVLLMAFSCSLMANPFTLAIAGAFCGCCCPCAISASFGGVWFGLHRYLFVPIYNMVADSNNHPQPISAEAPTSAPTSAPISAPTSAPPVLSSMSRDRGAATDARASKALTRSFLPSGTDAACIGLVETDSLPILAPNTVSLSESIPRFTPA